MDSSDSKIKSTNQGESLPGLQSSRKSRSDVDNDATPQLKLIDMDN
jgi:hypothetical protein